MSPLTEYGTKSSYSRLFQPSLSSPSPSSSPSNAVQSRGKRAYKSQISSRSTVVPLNLPGVLEDTSQKQSLRERFKARYLDRVKESKERAMRKGRANSSSDWSSSDGLDIDDDFLMDEEEEYNLDDELYRRVMMNEERRAKHSKRLSFECDFGSSIDPNMYEDIDALEWELTGQTSNYNVPPPPSEEWDDAIIQEYLDELEDTRQQEERKAADIKMGAVDVDKEDPSDLEREFTRGSDPLQPSPSRSMYSDFQMSSPPSSPSHPATSLPVPSASETTWNCPFCSTDTPRTHIACPSCMMNYQLVHAYEAWADPALHLEGQQRGHVPLAAKNPCIGIVMLCGASGCDWCFAL